MSTSPMPSADFTQTPRRTIALLTDGIPPYVMGGMQKHSLLLAEHLAALGTKVLLYHFVEEDQLPNEEAVLSHFSNRASGNITVRTFRYNDTGKLPGHYLRAQRAMSNAYLKSLIREDHRPDFIYCKGFMALEILKNRSVLPFACIIGVKFHGMNMFQKQPDWKGEIVKYMLRPTARRIMNEADVVFSYGGKITDIIARQLKDTSKIVELPSGIGADWLRPIDEITPVEKPLKLLFVGRFDRLKGLPELYKALESLHELPWLLTIVGPIPEKHRINHPRISYTGPVTDQNELKRMYDRNSVLLCPSISEGMPNVIMEAMARGLAIVATDVGATAILVDGTNGILMEPGSVLSLEKSLKEILNSSEEKIHAMQKAGRAKMEERFTWEVIAKEFAVTLEKLIKR